MVLGPFKLILTSNRGTVCIGYTVTNSPIIVRVTYDNGTVYTASLPVGSATINNTAFCFVKTTTNTDATFTVEYTGVQPGYELIFDCPVPLTPTVTPTLPPTPSVTKTPQVTPTVTPTDGIPFISCNVLYTNATLPYSINNVYRITGGGGYFGGFGFDPFNTYGSWGFTGLVRFSAVQTGGRDVFKRSE
jgi:hypothetical protein